MQDSPSSRGIAAATILGDGQIALILDPIDITRTKSAKVGDPKVILKEAS